MDAQVPARPQHRCRACATLHDPRQGIVCPACWDVVPPAAQRQWTYQRRRFDHGQITTRQLATAAEAVARAARDERAKISGAS